MYRSSDEAGEHQCDTGTYHHLLLVNVLRGKPLKTAEVWRGEGFGSVQSKLGQEHDSVARVYRDLQGEGRVSTRRPPVLKCGLGTGDG